MEEDYQHRYSSSSSFQNKWSLRHWFTNPSPEVQDIIDPTSPILADGGPTQPSNDDMLSNLVSSIIQTGSVVAPLDVELPLKAEPPSSGWPDDEKIASLASPELPCEDDLDRSYTGPITEHCVGPGDKHTDSGLEEPISAIQIAPLLSPVRKTGVSSSSGSRKKSGRNKRSSPSSSSSTKPHQDNDTTAAIATTTNKAIPERKKGEKTTSQKTASPFSTLVSQGSSRTPDKSSSCRTPEKGSGSSQQLNSSTSSESSHSKVHKSPAAARSKSLSQGSSSTSKPSPRVRQSGKDPVRTSHHQSAVSKPTSHSQRTKAKINKCGPKSRELLSSSSSDDSSSSSSPSQSSAGSSSSSSDSSSASEDEEEQPKVKPGHGKVIDKSVSDGQKASVAAASPAASPVLKARDDTGNKRPAETVRLVSECDKRQAVGANRTEPLTAELKDILKEVAAPCLMHSPLPDAVTHVESSDSLNALPGVLPHVPSFSYTVSQVTDQGEGGSSQDTSFFVARAADSAAKTEKPRHRYPAGVNIVNDRPSIMVHISLERVKHLVKPEPASSQLPEQGLLTSAHASPARSPHNCLTNTNSVSSVKVEKVKEEAIAGLETDAAAAASPANTGNSQPQAVNTDSTAAAAADKPKHKPDSAVFDQMFQASDTKKPDTFAKISFKRKKDRESPSATKRKRPRGEEGQSSGHHNQQAEPGSKG